MKSSPLACCLSFLLLGVAPLAQAQDEDASTSPFSGTFAVTSDYLFRGISQTNEEPAFQAGLTYKTPFGLYLGTWTSNVDFGAGDPDWEVDGFVGY
ncbi:TorF family putative porin, partial [Xanthomonas phaseoli]